MKIEFEENTFEAEEGTSVYELFKDRIEESNKRLIACRFNNEIKALDYRMKRDGKVELVDISNRDGRRIYIRGLLWWTTI